MDELINVKWYATILRHELFAREVAKAAPIALHYGATQYRVHVDGDDRYKITQMTWVPDHESWYAYWEGPEMVEFRARWMGKYQIPITYAWADEIVVGGVDAERFEDVGEVDSNPGNRPSSAATDSR